MVIHSPRLVVGGLGGDSGKTLASVGVMRALARRGLDGGAVQEGAGLHRCGVARRGRGTSRTQSRHVPDASRGARPVAARRGREPTSILIEGNRGLHDGADALGTHSTAELAKRLGAPVVVVVDATKATRTLAACVHGCAVIDPSLTIAGVILNRVATLRHERVVRDAFAAIGGPPVLGALPRLSPDPLPSRHLGLITAREHAMRESVIDRAADLAARHIDLDALLRSPVAPGPSASRAGRAARAHRLGADRAAARRRVLVLLPGEPRGAHPGRRQADRNLSAARRAPSGRRRHLHRRGIPEVHADALEANTSLRGDIGPGGEAGLPIYAECGGLMYLARELRHARRRRTRCAACSTSRWSRRDDRRATAMSKRASIRPTRSSPSAHGCAGTNFTTRAWPRGALASALQIERGVGLGNGRDGLVTHRVWASYLHLHALGTPEWAGGVVAAAARGAAGTLRRGGRRGGGSGERIMSTELMTDESADASSSVEREPESAAARFNLGPGVHRARPRGSRGARIPRRHRDRRGARRSVGESGRRPAPEMGFRRRGGGAAAGRSRAVPNSSMRTTTCARRTSIAGTRRRS